MRAYNLTGAQFAISNLALHRLKISRFQDLNDPFELLGVNLADKTHRAEFKRESKKMNKDKGLICFSKSWKSPLLWGHYAEKHTGIALGFEVPDNLLLEVDYAEKLSDISFDNITGETTRENIIHKLAKTKFKDWHYEEEVRLLLDLVPKKMESSMYFEPFSKNLQLREVILGPKCELPIKEIRLLVKSYKPKVEVIKSRIAFTRFEVLENKVATQMDQSLISHCTGLI